MTRIRLLPEAEEELRAAARFYEGLRVRHAKERIAERPKASRVERGDIRVQSILRFPYRLYYRVGPDEIVIVAVGHSRRRPGFWRNRT